MPVSANYQQRTAGHVDKSTFGTSSTTTPSAVGQSFAARKRDLTLTTSTGITSVVTLSTSSHTLSGTTATFQLTVTVLNTAGDQTFDPPVWSSDTPSKATVDQTGLVTGVATGSANITVTAGGVTSSACAITVP